MQSSLPALFPLLSALLWSAALIADPGPLAPGSVLLVGVGLIGTATVGGAGLVLSGGRWPQRTTAAALAMEVAVALIRPIDAIWVVSLVSTGVSVVLLYSGTAISLHQPEPAAGVPSRAALLPLILIGFPAVLGMTAWEVPSWGTLMTGITAPAAALWYARVFPGGLFAVRLLWPGVAIGLSVTQAPLPGLVSAGGGVLVAILAWHASVKLAFHPPREVGTRLPIPPELTPREVLEAADLDERGNPRK